MRLSNWLTKFVPVRILKFLDGLWIIGCMLAVMLWGLAWLIPGWIFVGLVYLCLLIGFGKTRANLVWREYLIKAVTHV